MSFSVKTIVSSCADLTAFIDKWEVGSSDLIITNEFLIKPRLNGKKLCSGVLYQEQFGKSEPTDEMVDAMLSAAEEKEYKRVIAVGGGTVIDIAKLFVFGKGLRCEEIFANGAKLPRKRGLVVVPTTCGTGSEVTNISIVEFKRKNTKLGLATPALFADEAVLIPSLLDSMPYDVFASSSIDALIHAVESYISPKADAFTQSLGGSAINLILKGYKNLVKSGNVGSLPEDFGGFLTASAMAGMAFGNAGCAAVHALSYPIGAVYHLPHGKANYAVFEGVISAYCRLGAELTALVEIIAGSLGCETGAAWVELFNLLDSIIKRERLGDLGADETDCAKMARSVILNQQRLLSNNPIALTVEDIEDIYKRCL